MSLIARLIAWLTSDAEVAWQKLGHHGPRIIVGIVIGFAIWGVVDVRKRGQPDPLNIGLHKTDVTVYTTAGAAFFDGRNPYAVANDRGWQYLYPPLLAIVMAPLSALSGKSQALVWFALSCPLFWGCFVEMRRICKRLAERATPSDGRYRAAPVWVVLLGGGAVLLPMLNCLQRGQVGVLLAYLLVLGYRILLEARSWRGSLLAGIVLALPIAIKLTPLLPAALLVLAEMSAAWNTRPRWQAWQRPLSLMTGGVFGLLLYLLVLPSCAVGYRANLNHLATWYHGIVANKNEIGSFNWHTNRNQSLSNAIYRCGNLQAFLLGVGPDDNEEPVGGVLKHTPFMAQPAVGWLTKFVQTVLVLMVSIVSVRAGRQHHTRGLAAAFALACALSLLVSPISWVHHYTLLLPAAILMPWTAAAISRPGWSMVHAAALTSTMVAHYVFVDFLGRAGALGLMTTLWLMGGCWLLEWLLAESAANSSPRILRVGALHFAGATDPQPLERWRKAS